MIVVVVVVVSYLLQITLSMCTEAAVALSQNPDPSSRLLLQNITMCYEPSSET